MSFATRPLTWDTSAVAESDPVHRAAEDLYGLPPGEFTGARDARVKEVRGAGDREAAAAIKALKKPTVAAWALNQLARRRAKDVERLVNAGEDLRAAPEELLAGGDRGAFQEAATWARVLGAELCADATAMASEAGERGSGLEEKVAGTLHAAALDERTADELRSGRLVRERAAIGGFGAAAAPPAPAGRGRGSGRSAPAPKASTKRARGRGRASVGREGAEKAEQRQRVGAARADERHARRELEAAKRALEHAQERAEAAAAHAEEAAERARTTAERLKDAKRSASAARKAHQGAERALESAERGSSRRS